MACLSSVYGLVVRGSFLVLALRKACQRRHHWTKPCIQTSLSVATDDLVIEPEREREREREGGRDVSFNKKVTKFLRNPRTTFSWPEVGCDIETYVNMKLIP